MPLLIDFIRIRRPTFCYTTAHAGSKSPLFTSGESSIHDRSTSLGFSFPPATPRADLLLRALLVLFESADSVIMFGGLG